MPGARHPGRVLGAASAPRGGRRRLLRSSPALRYAPLGGQFRTQDFDRKRRGIAGPRSGRASTAARPDRAVPALARDEHWGEHTFEAGSDLSEYNTFPAGC